MYEAPGEQFFMGARFFKLSPKTFRRKFFASPKVFVRKSGKTGFFFLTCHSMGTGENS